MFHPFPARQRREQALMELAITVARLWGWEKESWWMMVDGFGGIWKALGLGHFKSKNCVRMNSFFLSQEAGCKSI